MDSNNQIKIGDYCQHIATGRVFLCSKMDFVWVVRDGVWWGWWIGFSHELINDVLQPFSSGLNHSSYFRLYKIKKHDSTVLNQIIHDI